jgi:iron complex transport system ATP-binding protein
VSAALPALPGASIPVLELVGATVRYPGSPSAQLEQASLQVRGGECVAIVGPNGAGKTTALRALLGVAPLAAGRALVLGRDVGAWDRAALAREVAALGQREEPAFPITAEAAVAMGRYPYLGPWRRPGVADREAVAHAMALADVSALAGRWVGTLSGGEWQRVRLARALAQEPRALVLDEPTTSLDLRHEMELFELVSALVRTRQLAALIVSHHLNAAARFADRLVLVAAGRIVADDTPERVLQGPLSDVFGWPVAVHRLPDGSLQLHPERRAHRGDSG